MFGIVNRCETRIEIDMTADKPGKNPEKADVSIILENPYLRSVVDELLFLDEWNAGRVSPVSAALRVRQIRNAKLVPDKA